MDIINIIVIATILFLVGLVVWLAKMGPINAPTKMRIHRVRKTLDRATFDQIIENKFPNASKKELDDLYESFVNLIKVLNE